MVIVIAPREIIAMRHTDVIISVFFIFAEIFLFRDSNFSFNTYKERWNLQV